MTRRDHEQRPDRDRTLLGVRARRLDLLHAGKTFLRRRGIDAGRFGIYLHRIDAPDPGLDLHDHPWPFVSIILRGGYVEHHAEILGRETDWLYCPGCGCARCSHRPEGCRYHAGCTNPGLAPIRSRAWNRFTVHRMPLDVAHRIVAADPGTVTLIVRGRKSRTWGFYLPTGWVEWTAYDYDTRRPVAVESSHPEEHRPTGSTIPGAPPC